MSVCRVMVVVGSLGLWACGNSEGQSQPTDAAMIDADECRFLPTLSSCNPYIQYGCDCDEKCGELLVSEDPYLTQTACMPLGETQPGMPCTTGKPGESTGFDTCTAGFACSQGICAEICDGSDASSCRGVPDLGLGKGEVCVVDVDERTPGRYSSYGHCIASCDPALNETIDDVVINKDCGPGFFCDLRENASNAHCARTVLKETDGLGTEAKRANILETTQPDSQKYPHAHVPTTRSRNE